MTTKQFVVMLKMMRCVWNMLIRTNRNVGRARIFWIAVIICIANYFGIFELGSVITTNSNEENRQSKDLHFLSREEPYRSRMLGIQERCSTIKDPLKLPIRIKTMKYKDNIKTVMCEVPKVASTSWKTLILKLGGYTKEVTLREVHQGNIPNKHFDQLRTDKEAIARMEEYLTFMVTRHPFERLVSAHNDKFAEKNPFHYYKKRIGRVAARSQSQDYLNGVTFTSEMLEDVNVIYNSPQFKELTEEKQNEVLNYLNVMKTGALSFHQFIKYILTFSTPSKAKTMDAHWRPQTYLCMPCTYNYSYVIRFENLSVESNRLIDYLQTYHNASRSEIKRFPDRSPTIKHDTTTQAFAEIPEKDIEALRKIYRDDFYILGYNPYLYNGYE